ncbi:MAG: hemolysin III family protein [Clostridia bacterium]|nr:hemolysin III family protein [Clostridia bacterium]
MSVKRTKLEDRVLPTYTKGEEIFNMTSHIVGAILGIVSIVLTSVIAVKNQVKFGVISGVIMGVALILLYTMSSVYHGLSPKLKAKKVLQIIDHCSIFILIAGCATPFAMCLFMKESIALGWTIFGLIWLVAIIGIVLNSIDLKKYKKFSMFCYLAMGWCFLIRADLLYKYLGIGGLTLLIVGGIAYTIGAVLYGMGKNKKWMHSIFHLFCVLGSLLHVLCVLIYVL